MSPTFVRVTGGLILDHVGQLYFPWASKMRGNRVLFESMLSSVVVWDIAERRYTIFDLERDDDLDWGTTWVRRPQSGFS